MFRPIGSLPLSDSTVSQLKDNGFHYVEDVKDISASTTSCPNAVQEAQGFCKVPTTVSASGIVEEEKRRLKISTLSRELDNLLDGGFHAKTITELSGEPGSGKTEICLQTCIGVQLSRTRVEPRGKALFIDIEGGLSAQRLEEMVKGSQAHFRTQDFDVDKILDRVIIAAPQSFEELADVVNNFEQLPEYSEIRLIVVDSFTYLRYSVENSFNRTQFSVNILSQLYRLSTKHNLAVIVTSELLTHIKENGGTELAPAGGTLCAHTVHKRVMLTRLDDERFEACLIKSLTSPKVAAKFQVTTNGIRDTFI